MKEKKEYIAPAIVVVSFKAEIGYASSMDLVTALPFEEEGQMESYTTANDWSSGSGTFWD